MQNDLFSEQFGTNDEQAFAKVAGARRAVDVDKVDVRRQIDLPETGHGLEYLQKLDPAAAMDMGRDVDQMKVPQQFFAEEMLNDRGDAAAAPAVGAQN